jgi:hypothetical protein
MGSSDELSFDHCFYIYGGRQSFEELEALGNECARLCNRLRSKLAPEGKAQLDAALASLGPFFDLQVSIHLFVPAQAAARATGSSCAPFPSPLPPPHVGKALPKGLQVTFLLVAPPAAGATAFS